jgi:hypothetical protein
VTQTKQPPINPERFTPVLLEVRSLGVDLLVRQENRQKLVSTFAYLVANGLSSN